MFLFIYATLTFGTACKHTCIYASLNFRALLRRSRIAFGLVRENTEDYGKIDLDDMDSVGAQIENINYDSRFLLDSITIISKSIYASMDNGWQPPIEHFDIKLDDTIAMTEIERFKSRDP